MPVKLSLPLIDVSSYLKPLPEDLVEKQAILAERQVTASKLDKACKDFGFFYVTGHGVESKLQEELLEMAQTFFKQTDEEKDSIAIWKSLDKVRGWQKLGENITYGTRDIQEAIDVYPPVSEPSSEPFAGVQLWPSNIPSFKEKYEYYCTRMKLVGDACITALADGLVSGLQEEEGVNGIDAVGIKEYIEKMTDDPYWVLRIIGYPPLESVPDEKFGKEKGISCGAHTDYGCLTFLLQSPIAGSLQVESKTGEWIPGDPVEGAYVVNIGDIIDVLTCSRYRSTYHRVIHGGDKFRVSIPFFYEPSRAAIIHPLKDCLPKDGSEPKVKEVAYFQHLTDMIYNHFAKNDEQLKETPNANKLTNRG